MAIYRQVMLTFWTDSFINDNFSAEDKYFYLYLLTNLHTNLCGCYEVSEKQIAKEMGYSLESIEAILDRFTKTYDLIRYNRVTKELLVLKWSKYNWNASSRFRVAVENELEKVKDESFRDYLEKLLDGEEIDKKIYPIDRVMSENANPNNPIDTTVTVTVTDTVNSSNSINSINIEEVDKEKKVKSRVRKKYEDTPEFEAFWNAYPKVKQKSKQEAREAFAKVDVPLQTLLDALEIQKKSHDWTKEGGQYIPYPAKWLNKRRWEDATDTTQQTDRYANLRRLMEECEDE